jgi:hypothetical protein
MTGATAAVQPRPTVPVSPNAALDREASKSRKLGERPGPPDLGPFSIYVVVQRQCCAFSVFDVL